MANQNCSTYQLSAAAAKSLRVQRIHYLHGIVPRATIAACVDKNTIAYFTPNQPPIPIESRRWFRGKPYQRFHSKVGH